MVVFLARWRGIRSTSSKEPYSFGCLVTAAILSKSKDVLAEFRKHDMALDLPQSNLRGWTDDFSDVLGPFLRKMKW